MFKVWQIIPGYLSCWKQPLLDYQSAPGNYLLVQEHLNNCYSHCFINYRALKHFIKMLVHHHNWLWIICHTLNILVLMFDKLEFLTLNLDLNLNGDLDQVRISNSNMMTWHQ